MLQCICYVTDLSAEEAARAQFEEKYNRACGDRRSDAAPSIIFIHVPGLPRNATIEWEFVVHTAAMGSSDRVVRYGSGHKGCPLAVSYCPGSGEGIVWSPTLSSRDHFLRQRMPHYFIRFGRPII